MQTRKDTSIYLVGHQEPQICGSKLPSNRQVLSVFYWNHQSRGFTVREAARMAIREVFVFWAKARIPTRAEPRCIDKLEDLVSELQKLKKTTRNTDTHRRNEDKFTETLDDLFDIAHANSLQTIKNADDRAFLLAQREKGRQGSMIGVDAVEAARENRKQARLEEERKRKRKCHEQKTAGLFLQKIPRRGTESSVVSTGTESSGDNYVPPAYEAVDDSPDLPRPSKRNFMNSRLLGVLDRCKISDRWACHIVAAVAEALGHRLDELVINRTSLRQQRQKYREELALQAKEGFQVTFSLFATDGLRPNHAHISTGSVWCSTLGWQTPAEYHGQ